MHTTLLFPGVVCEFVCDAELVQRWYIVCGVQNPPFEFEQDAGQRIDEKNWVQWYEPLLRATAANPRLLGWLDFHAYHLLVHL